MAAGCCCCWEGGGEGGASRSDEAQGEIGAEVRHPEESVSVDFGSVKSQKNMLNIWSLVQRGEGSEGPPESTGGEVLKTTNTPLLLPHPAPFPHILPG